LAPAWPAIEDTGAVAGIGAVGKSVWVVVGWLEYRFWDGSTIELLLLAKIVVSRRVLDGRLRRLRIGCWLVEAKIDNIILKYALFYNSRTRR